MKKNSIALAFSLLCFCCGCSSGPTSTVNGGTEGTLKAGDFPAAEFELKLYESGKASPLGTAVTNGNGEFRLMLTTGEGPLWLSEGDYVVTLESIGPAAPRVLPTYRDVAKSPLKVQWKSTDKSLDLKIPAFK